MNGTAAFNYDPNVLNYLLQGMQAPGPGAGSAGGGGSNLFSLINTLSNDLSPSMSPGPYDEANYGAFGADLLSGGGYTSLLGAGGGGSAMTGLLAGL